MCQLTFTNLQNKKLNNVLYLIQSWENATANPDGFGLRVGKYGVNSSIPMKNCNNLGMLLRRHNNTADPILSHVRLATAIGGKKTIDDSTTHPFVTDKLVVAHNGMIDLKTHDSTYKDEKVDSIIFLKELEKELLVTENVPDAIKKTVDRFYGTFAFLIQHIESGKYYAVKGTAKKLHFVRIFDVTREEKVLLGYSINTNDADQQSALIKFSNLAQLLYGIDVDWDKSADLDANSIYELGEYDVTKVGSVTESARPFQSGVTNSGNHTPYGNTSTNTATSGHIENPKLNVLLDLAASLGLYLEELDHIALITIGRGICNFQSPDLDKLIEVLNATKSMHTDHKDSLWTSLKSTCLTHRDRKPPYTLHPYVKYGLKFPYYLNSDSVLEKALKDAINEDFNSIQ